MALTVIEATEADVPELMRVQYATFKGGPTHDALFPGNNADEVIAITIELTIKGWRDNPKKRVSKCVDENTGQIIGLGIWEIDDDEKEPASVWKKGGTANHLQGEQRRLAEVFLKTQHDARRRIWGDNRHCYCSMIGVHPEHQRRGAGLALMKWGLKLADEAGTPTYLTTSRAGRPLYQKLGFEDVTSEDIVIKAEEWGGSFDCPVWPMIRPVPIVSV